MMTTMNFKGNFNYSWCNAVLLKGNFCVVLGAITTKIARLQYRTCRNTFCFPVLRRWMAEKRERSHTRVGGRYTLKLMPICGSVHRWTRGGVEGGHPPLVAEISPPLELKYPPPPLGWTQHPPPFFVPGQIFLNGNV